MLGVIAAAGLGSRMKSDLPKPLTLLPNGESFLSTAIQKLANHVDEIVVVTSNAVLKHPSFSMAEGCHYRTQLSPTGMGDAVFTVSDLIKQHDDVMIMWCDQIGITTETISRTTDLHKSQGGANQITIPLLWKDSGYIDFQIKNGCIDRILQAREGDVVSEIAHSDIGLFLLSNGAQLVANWFDGGREFSRGIVTSEYNFLPFLKFLNSNGWNLNCLEAVETDGIGVNSTEELIKALPWLNK